MTIDDLVTISLALMVFAAGVITGGFTMGWLAMQSMTSSPPQGAGCPRGTVETRANLGAATVRECER